MWLSASDPILFRKKQKKHSATQKNAQQSANTSLLAIVASARTSIAKHITASCCTIAGVLIDSKYFGKHNYKCLSVISYSFPAFRNPPLN